MKKIIKILKSEESGQALIMAMILMVVGSLVLVPLLTFVQSGMNSGQVVEDKVDKVYAADAGVEEAVWQIKHLGEPGAIPLEELDELYEYYDYTLEGKPLPNVNGIDVNVRIIRLDNINGGVYRVLSTAGDTRVEAFITTVWADYGYFLERVITSGSEIGFPPAHGNPSQIIPSDPEDPHGPKTDFPDELWPTAEEMIAFYLQYVDTEADLYGLEELNIRALPVPRFVGPLYRDGYLKFTSSGGSGPVSAELTGTVYITGDMDTAPNEITIDLSGQTIFCGGEIYIAPQFTFTGSGCIIAVGDIWFNPQIVSEPGDFIFLMSIDGIVHLNPQSDFYGAIAGNIEVSLQPGVTINYIDPPLDGDGNTDLDFPSGDGDLIWGVHTWEIEYTGA